MELEITCYSITSFLCLDETRQYKVEFGLPVHDIRQVQAKFNNIFTWDCRFVALLPEDQFLNEKKFCVGQKYMLTYNDGRLEVQSKTKEEPLQKS